VRWLMLIAFAMLAALTIHAHTLWFDEMQAWNIARASGSVGDLASNLRYEGHPILWYLPLLVLTRFTGNSHAMQVLQWCITVTTAALVLFHAPLKLSLRVLLLAGYFFAFEYGVFARSYGLGALLLVTALLLVARPQPRWIWATVALVALAFTSLPGAVVAIAFAGAIALDSRLRQSVCARALAIVVVVISAAVAFVCIPPDDFGNLTPGIGDSSRFGSGAAVRVASSAGAVWRALVPLPSSIGQWNSNVLDRQAGAVWIEAALSVALFGVVFVVFRGRPFARRLWWIGNLGLFAFFLVVTRPEAIRHAGFAFLLFVACVWCAYAPPGEQRIDDATTDRGTRDTLATVVLVVLAAQVVATLAVLPSASTEDFSRDRVLADAVHRAHLDDAIVSAQDWDATTIGGSLDRSVWSLARGESIKFLTTDARQERGLDRLNTKTVACGSQRRANEVDRPVAVVVAGTLPGHEVLVRHDGATIYRFVPGPLPVDCN
ncbi:MAG: hypothetical protein ABW073_01900, partial [Acidimicrobiia bacterium]